MDSSAPSKNNRWYDKQPIVRQSIEILSVMPDEVLSILAEGINLVIEDEYKVQALLRSFKSLGQAKVLALYKAKNKLRKLDQNPAMHKTVNYLFVISEENQLRVAQHVLELVSLIYDYTQLMQTSGQPIAKEDLIRLRDGFVAGYANGGLEQAHQQLRQIKQRLQDNGNLQPSNTPLAENPESDPGESVRIENLEIKDDHNGGLKLNLNRSSSQINLSL